MFKPSIFFGILLFTIFYSKITTANGLMISFTPNSVTIHEDDIITVEYIITDINATRDKEFLIYSDDKNIASLETDVILLNPARFSGGAFNISGNFLGKTTIVCKNLETHEKAEGNLNVIVIRKQRIIDTVFTISVALFVTVIYINIGCAVDWSEIPSMLKRPIGPSIGFFGQFIVLPVLSYILGLILFPDSTEMQLGLFFSGVAPPGGSTNLFAVLLDGNLNLSILMTTLSTIAAFGTIPIWVFTLGKVIFDRGHLTVPYAKITTYVMALIVPLGIGYLIQRYCKNFADFLKKILKGLSVILIFSIITFASITNKYLFQLFSWRIIIASMALPWLAYIIGYLMAYLFRQSYSDSITIAIKIGVQNTGIPIFLLRFALPQPEADLTTIVPVAVSVFTPVPLVILFLWLKIRERFLVKKRETEITSGTDNLMKVAV